MLKNFELFFKNTNRSVLLYQSVGFVTKIMLTFACKTKRA